MYSIVAPTRNGITDYDEIVALRRPATSTLLNPRHADINAAYSAYISCSGNGRALRPISVTTRESGALRTNFRALDRGRSHASIRDEILGSARFDACPYCNVSTVTTIDHALPRSAYPEFSVLAQNLIPACGLCNLKKADICFELQRINLMHPYYVNIPAEPILFVRVAVAASHVTWTFFLRRHASMTYEQFDAINNLFTVLDLSDRYHQVSVGDVMDRTGHLDELHQELGPDAVARYLRMEAQSALRSRGENYWKTALLRGLGNDRSFCDGGFRKLIR